MFMLGMFQKMNFSNKCQICGSANDCNHASTKKWKDAAHLDTINLGEIVGEITSPDAILAGTKDVKSKTDMVANTMTSTAQQVFIKCNFCQADVMDAYLTPHIQCHISQKYIEDANIRVAKPLQEENKNVSLCRSNSPIEEAKPLEEVTEEDFKKFLGHAPSFRMKNFEPFEFRKVKGVSFYGTTNKQKRYSDFTLLIWLPENVQTYNATYTGASNSYITRSNEKLQIHIVYDNVENYYTISGKLYKKTGHSEFDVEESSIPNRVCEQDQLMKEIKRALLFFRLPPLSIFKLFRKAMNMPFSFIEDKESPTTYMSGNHTALVQEQIKGPVASTSMATNDDDEAWGAGYCG
jgi:hypothetical protein